jgi:hypothetical protein
MMLYIGSDKPIPIIPFKENAPGFHTEKLSGNDSTIANHFSVKNVLYAGSSQGCGCGFQHSILDSNTGWLNVEDEDDKDFRMNMQGLFEYVREALKKGAKVQLYACWDGEFEDSPLSKEAISCKDLLNKKFYLKEKGFYIII